MKRTICWIALLLTVVPGCASLQSVTSGQVGCSEDEIVITNDESGWGTRTWTARCRGKTFYCSAHGGGEQSTPQVACKEQTGGAPAPAAAPGAAPGGCQYDTQCKGERVCQQGRCVDPQPATQPAPQPADATP